MDKAGTAANVAHATSALVRELTGGGIYYLPARSAADIARTAFRQNMLDNDNHDFHLDVTMACIRVLEQNLARGRKLGESSWGLAVEWFSYSSALQLLMHRVGP